MPGTMLKVKKAAGNATRKLPTSVSCPVCGFTMFEVDRSWENGCLYVWYECSEEGCWGQQLRKELNVSRANV